jgi:hypothetical protein
MASVDEVRTGVSLALQQANDSLGALQQADLSLGQSESALRVVTQGSTQPEPEQAIALLQQARQQVTDAVQNVQSAVTTAEGYAARL